MHHHALFVVVVVVLVCFVSRWGLSDFTVIPLAGLELI